MTDVPTQGKIISVTDKEILQKLKDYMVKHNLRQWEFAQRLNIPEKTLSRWLNKKANISAAYLRILKKEGII